MRDDADDPVIVIDDRDGDEVVLADDPGDFLLVLVDADVDDVGLHDVPHQRRELGQDQMPQRDEAQQLAVFIRDVDVVDRFLLGGLLPEAVDRFFDGDIRE